MAMRVRLSAGWVSRRYGKERRMINWHRDPYLRLAKIAATLLHERKVRGKALAARVREILPDIDEAAGCEVRPNLLRDRGDKGVRYRSEHYSASEVTAELAELVAAHLDHGMVWRRG